MEGAVGIDGLGGNGEAALDDSTRDLLNPQVLHTLVKPALAREVTQEGVGTIDLHPVHKGHWGVPGGNDGLIRGLNHLNLRIVRLPLSQTPGGSCSPESCQATTKGRPSGQQLKGDLKVTLPNGKHGVYKGEKKNH